MHLHKVMILMGLLLLPLIPTFWAIRDIPGRRFETLRQKIMWFLVVAAVPFFGALFYLGCARRRTRPAGDPPPPQEA